MSQPTRDAPRRGDRPAAARPRRSGRAVDDPIASNRVDALLDEGLAETFPASDPVAVTSPGSVTFRNT
jgi:hypothetical protein